MLNHCITDALASSANRVVVPQGGSTSFTLTGGVAQPFSYFLSLTAPLTGVSLGFTTPSSGVIGGATVGVTASPSAPVRARATITASAWTPAAIPSVLYNVPISLEVACPTGTSWCALQNGCVAGACTCAAGLSLCDATNTCVANPADPAQCPVAFDCSACTCGCNAAGSACAAPARCPAAACAKAGGVCDVCGGCVVD